MGLEEDYYYWPQLLKLTQQIPQTQFLVEAGLYLSVYHNKYAMTTGWLEYCLHFRVCCLFAEDLISGQMSAKMSYQ